jgi:hypothetical protein
MKSYTFIMCMDLLLKCTPVNKKMYERSINCSLLKCVFHNFLGLYLISPIFLANKPEPCVNPIVNKVPMHEIFVDLTCVYRTQKLVPAKKNCRKKT